VEHALSGLTECEATDIANRFSEERYHHEVNPAALVRLLAKTLPDSRPAYANPLWLQLAIEELNLLEADDFEEAERRFPQLQGADRMRALLTHVADALPADVPGIYGCLLERAETHFGRDWCRAVVNAIALSRAGWREDDLRALVPLFSSLPWDDLTFAGLRRALGGHLVRRGTNAQWDFFHAQLRPTVLARNLPERSARQQLHSKLADYLQSQPSGDPLRASKSMHHFLGHADHHRAVEYMATLDTGSLERHGTREVLSRAIESAQSAGDGVSVMDWLAACLELSDLDGEARRSAVNVLLFDVSDAIAIGARCEGDRARLLQIVRLSLERTATNGMVEIWIARDLSVSYNKLGDLHLGLGQGAHALEFYQKALAIREALHQRNPQSADFARDLSYAHGRIAQLGLAGRSELTNLQWLISRLLLEKLDIQGRLPDKQASEVLAWIRTGFDASITVDVSDDALASAYAELGREYYIEALALRASADTDHAQRCGGLAIVFFAHAALLGYAEANLATFATTACDHCGVLADWGRSEADPSAAIEIARRALARMPADDSDYAFNRAATLGNLGHALFRLGEMRAKRETIEEGLRTLEAARDHLRTLDNESALAEVEDLILRAGEALLRCRGSSDS
jgi:tetratricopeptide (TPR) repeat protein